MISKIFGKIIEKDPFILIVRTGGIGFEVLVSGKTYEKVPAKGEDAELEIYTYVREDSIKLIGFFDKKEKEIFIKLISVSGISVKIALSALSIYDSGQLKEIIIKKEIEMVRRIPGVGKKLAERMILELKDKLGEESGETGLLIGITENENILEVRQALRTLGYNNNEIDKAVLKLSKVDLDDKKVEDILKLALREV